MSADPARLAALEAVADAARSYVETSGMTTMELVRAFTALDALPAPAPQPETSPITREEMVAMFGEAMPVAAVELLWDSAPNTSVAEIRAKLRALAKPAPAQAQVETVEVWEHDGGILVLVRDGARDTNTLAQSGYYRRLGTVALPLRVEGGGE